MLTETNLVSDYVDLSEKQIKRLKDKHAKLSEEVYEFIQKKRLEASEIFEDELSREQKERLVEVVGGDAVSSSFERADSRSLIRHSKKATAKDRAGQRIEIWRTLGERKK